MTWQEQKWVLDPIYGLRENSDEEKGNYMTQRE